MKNHLFILALAMVSTSSMATPLSSADRSEVQLSTKNACIKRQTNALENANLTAGQIANFCTCVANRTANTMTAEQANYINSTNDPTPMIDATMAAYSWCAN